MYKPKMVTLLLIACLAITFSSNAQTNAIVDKQVVFEEENGILTIEAEYFYKQSNNDVRQWYRWSKDEEPNAGKDHDPTHAFGASNNAYLEILPDTRVTHDDELITGVSFSNETGVMGFLHYKTFFNTPGRYYVWVRAYSTGTEDNGLHVGLNGEWPESGARMQWCEGKNSWRWESKQRTDSVHCGEPYLIYLDIDKAGEHEIMFSMSEDGFEFDKFILTTDKNYVPEGINQDIAIKTGKLPKPFPVLKKMSESYSEAFAENNLGNITLIKATKFPTEGNNFYIDQEKWLAINPEKAKEATSSITYNNADGVFDVTILAVGENDGSSAYTLKINDIEKGNYKAPLSTKMFEENAAYCKTFEGISLKK